MDSNARQLSCEPYARKVGTHGELQQVSLQRTRGERGKVGQYDAEPVRTNERPVPAINEATGQPTKRAHLARLNKKVLAIAPASVQLSEVNPLGCLRCAAC